jgi:hypothetical protein
MKTIRISDLNHVRLRKVLLELMDQKQNPALTMDDAVGVALDALEAKTA